MDVSGDKKAMARIRRACEVAKRTLSTQTSAQIEIESLHQGIDFSLSISRAKFEELCIDLFKNTLAPVKQVTTKLFTLLDKLLCLIILIYSFLNLYV